MSKDVLVLVDEQGGLRVQDGARLRGHIPTATVLGDDAYPDSSGALLLASMRAISRYSKATSAWMGCRCGLPQRQ